MLNHSDTTHTIYDILQPAYWDPASLEAEMQRVFDICNGCRLCWNLCPSFPVLFNALDEQGRRKREAAVQSGRVKKEEERPALRDLPEGEHAAEASIEAEFVGDVTELTEGEKWRVVDLCYQCKLCDPICPYTPGKEHEFQLDFPRLMLRAQAVRTRSRGITRSDKFLSRTDATGRMGARLAPLSNWANRIRPLRFLLEKTAGIHRDRILPEFHRETFEKWFRKHRRAAPLPTEPVGRVVIFATCYTNANNPDLGRAAVEVLEHNNVEVQLPPQQCCGAPYLSYGDFEAFRKQAQPNIEEFAEWVGRGYQLVVTGPPTCSMTLTQDIEYLNNGDPQLAEKIAKVASNTLDISQYLMQLHKEGQLRTDFVHELGTVNYHLPCHLKFQRRGFKSRDLLRLVPGTKVNMVDLCSGMDGGWGMKTEYFEDSLKVAGKLVEGLKKKEAAYTCTDCTLAGLQIKQAAEGVFTPVHPIQLVHYAYGLGGG